MHAFDLVRQGTQMTLTCSICHGYGIYFFLSDEGLQAGANWSVEIATCHNTVSSAGQS